MCLTGRLLCTFVRTMDRAEAPENCPLLVIVTNTVRKWSRCRRAGQEQ